MVEDKNKNDTKKGTTKTKRIEKSLTKDYDKENEKSNKEIKEIVEIKKDDNAIIQKRNLLISFIIGLAIGLLAMGIFIPDRIAKLDNGQEVIVEMGDQSITANELYSDMKEYFNVSVLLDKIDTKILNNLYSEDSDMKKSVNETADYYISMYETSYGYSQEEFLNSNGFSTYDDFIKYLLLDYRRDLYFNDYLKKSITDDEIKKYYDKSVFGDIKTKYISIDASTNESTAENLAKEIINKLKNGKNYEDIISEYKDRITYDDLGYVAFDSSQDSEFINSLKNLKNSSYTTTSPEINNKYYIIFREDQKEKDSQDNLKDRIINVLIQEKKNNDSTLKYKSLNNLRKENNVKIKDTDLQKKYEKYLKQYTESK